MTTFQIIAQAISVLANLAVVITVFFILRQINVAVSQTTESRTANGLTLWNTILNQAIDFYMTLTTSDLTELYRKGRLTPDLLSDYERGKFFYLAVAWLSIQENIFACSQMGYLPDEHFIGWTKAFDEDLKDPGFQWAWEKEGQLFDLQFQRRVNATLSVIHNA